MGPSSNRGQLSSFIVGRIERCGPGLQGSQPSSRKERPANGNDASSCGKSQEYLAVRTKKYRAAAGHR